MDAALAAKAAKAAVPIIFAGGEDPVKLGLVASLARPGGNVSGIAVPATELEGKRIRLLRELVPTATAISVLLNPARPAFDAQSKDIEEAARAVRQELHILQASSEHEIGFAFAISAQWRPGALLVAPDAFLDSRREQLITLAKSHAIPTIYHNREFVAAGVHRGARVIGTDALRILVISQEASGGEEGNQDNEDNPNIDAHQNSCRRFVPADTQKQKKAPGTR